MALHHAHRLGAGHPQIQLAQHHEHVDQPLDVLRRRHAGRDQRWQRLWLGAEHVDEGLLGGLEPKAANRRVHVQLDGSLTEPGRHGIDFRGARVTAETPPDQGQRPGAEPVRCSPAGEQIGLVVIAVGGARR